jgi:hypothetical protein
VLWPTAFSGVVWSSTDEVPPPRLGTLWKTVKLFATGGNAPQLLTFTVLLRALLLRWLTELVATTDTLQFAEPALTLIDAWLALIGDGVTELTAPAGPLVMLKA